MGSRSAIELLQLPVQLHGIRLGQPVDVLLDASGSRALGLVVHCGDDSDRFLAYAAADPGGEEIAVPSALLLLEDVAFYLARSRSLRAVLGASVAAGDRELGELRDVLLAHDGRIETLVVERDGERRELSSEGVSFESPSVSRT